MPQGVGSHSLRWELQSTLSWLQISTMCISHKAAHEYGPWPAEVSVSVASSLAAAARARAVSSARARSVTVAACLRGLASYAARIAAASSRSPCLRVALNLAAIWLASFCAARLLRLSFIDASAAALTLRSV